MSADERELIRRTAPLHDIGKVGIPDAILRKSGPLDDEEIAAMQRHTVIGARILDGGRHRILHMARDIAEAHHERWDGGGYPHGLRGEAIPIEARLVAVADTFDVMTHARPYKRAASPQEAVAEIVRCAGSQFDPAVAASIAAINARVGPSALPALVDPIDPWVDTSLPAMDPALR
jgi:putative two-component system response regulator